jgi:hypothetical protein
MEEVFIQYRRFPRQAGVTTRKKAKIPSKPHTLVAKTQEISSTPLVSTTLCRVWRELRRSCSPRNRCKETSRRGCPTRNDAGPDQPRVPTSWLLGSQICPQTAQSALVFPRSQPFSHPSPSSKPALRQHSTSSQTLPPRSPGQSRGCAVSAIRRDARRSALRSLTGCPQSLVRRSVPSSCAYPSQHGST